ncbi:MAG: hypothetical protein QOG74_3207 [Alphaproteobacteria bacterium]|jgi:hypothetical protein|nr:hypothetical protein [Alphaproteobacteria bacterium]
MVAVCLTRFGANCRGTIFSIEPARRVVDMALVFPFFPGTTAARPATPLEPTNPSTTHETDP